MLKIILTAYNMGPEATEEDFDAWAAYVCNHIDEGVGFTVDDVDQFRLNSGQATDRIEDATPEQTEAIRRWLATDGWESFCAEMSERDRAAEAIA